jgi:hypothetical protein
MAVTGMNLELKNKRDGICRVVVQTLVMFVGWAGMVSGAAADSFSGLADPTQPAYTAAARTGAVEKSRGPALQSTFISATQRRAVISGKSYVVGDKFGGGIITDIQPYEVVLKKADRETSLRLLPKLAKESLMVKLPANSQEGGVK